MLKNSVVKPLVRDANPLCGLFLGFLQHSDCHSNQTGGSCPSVGGPRLTWDLPFIPVGGSAGIDIRDAKITIGAHSIIGTY